MPEKQSCSWCGRIFLSERLTAHRVICLQRPELRAADDDDSDEDILDHLRTGLGEYPDGIGLGMYWLCKDDLIEFCYRLGHAAGLDARREFLAPYIHARNEEEAAGRIDVVWLCPQTGRVFYAHEIEGRDATMESIENDVRKFNSSGAPFSSVMLFQIKNDRRRPKGGGTAERVAQALRARGSAAKVFMDVDLFAPRAAERLIEATKRDYERWLRDL